MIGEVQEHIPLGADHLGKIVPRYSLTLPTRESVDLSFYDSPIDVWAVDDNESQRFYAAPDHPPLGGQQLLSFLRQIAPNKTMQSALEVISDWRIVDQTGDGNDYANDIVRQHQRMGRSWLDFMKSRQAFLSVMEEDIGPPYFGRWLDEIFLSPDELSSSCYQYLISFASKSIKDMIEVLNSGGIEDAESLIFEALSSEVNQSRRGLQPITNRDKITSRYRDWGKARQHSFMSHFFRSTLPEDKANDLIQSVADRDFTTFTSEDGQSYSYPKAHLAEGFDLQGCYDNRQTVKRMHFEAEVMDFIDEKGDISTIVMPGSLKQHDDFKPHLIKPLISWQKDSSDRRRFVIERGLEGDKTYIDGVLGILAVAYLSPSITRKWPIRKGITSRTSKNYSFEQRMTEAQVPVLALLLRDELLSSDFIKVAEDLAT